MPHFNLNVTKKNIVLTEYKLSSFWIGQEKVYSASTAVLFTNQGNSCDIATKSKCDKTEKRGMRSGGRALRDKAARLFLPSTKP